MKRIALLVMVCMLSISLLSGCGTVALRGPAPHFGAYPYQGTALVCDATIKSYRNPGLAALCLVSVPCDFVLDTLLLPVDLAFWVRGKHKRAITM
jgi:uncharacterized protein YceK